MIPTRMRTLLAVVATFGVLAGCTTGSGDLDSRDSAKRSATTGTTPENTGGELDWGRCKGDLARSAGLQCAALVVPRDPAEPKGPTVELALARKKATGEADQRIGSLLFNPGGPGGSGIEALAGLTTRVPDTLSERFDLVSWDPRGVGESSPVRCLTDAQRDAQIEGDLSPETEEQKQRAVKDQAELRSGCEKRNPDAVEHMSTADVAADLDRIRAAVGDDKLSYVGFSYGTAIGATYATLFPDKVRALVLDGSVSPSDDPLATNIAQAEGFERTYLSFVQGCEASTSCALKGGTAAKVDALRQRLDQTPVEVKTRTGTRSLGRDQFDIGLATALYDTSLWGIVASAIADFDNGGADVMLALMDTQVGRNPDGTWSNQADAQVMVNCADTAQRPTAEEALALSPQLTAASPTFGPTFSTAMLSCVDWPTAANPTPRPSAPSAPPVMVVGTVGDPATPYVWAQEMTKALGSATLLTYEGNGHTAFTRGGACIDDAVTAYLVDLTVPAPGTSCPAQADDADFTGIREVLVKELVKAGLPQEVADCVVDGIVADQGEGQLALLLLRNDPDEQEKVLGKLIMSLTAKCISGG